MVLSSSASPPCSLTPKEAPVAEDIEIAHGVEAEIGLGVEKETDQQPTPLPHRINRQKRACLGKGKKILPPTEAQLKGYLKFTIKPDNERRDIKCDRKTSN
ncbi:hypothetical protein M9H77_31642 [Catharanthus roseus]|uniref:Uncharacterized protein n=1 Tax=Catharanthus roseus TaxID=4058 RepID=A0ACC0A2I3_CATRO|nr:hypothetical protein M9H77_31642 [Catharanthus roseus]